MKANTTSSTSPSNRSPQIGFTFWRGALLLLLPGLLIALGAVTGCQQPRAVFSELNPDSVVPPPAANASQPVTSTLLHEGDSFRIAFEGDTNLNTVAKIQLDGAVMLPLIGAVKAVGKTLEELQADLRRRYQSLLKVNEINLTLVGTSASVYVSGSVLHPGRIAMDRPLTALEAIMEAGGFDLVRAKPSAVTVLRLENGKQKHYPINLKAALRGDDPAPFQLKAFDIIHVPEKTFNF